MWHKKKLTEKKHDPEVLLYYKVHEKTQVTKKHLSVSVKVEDGESFVLTLFFTGRVRIGEKLRKLQFVYH